VHVLLLNWRDLKHPRKGGAEVLTHGIFARLVERGHRVTWVASGFPGAAQREVVDGIEVVRGGNAVTVRAAAYNHYATLRDVSIVVDEINTLPFFTPLYARVPVIAFVCQLAREVWFYETPPVVAQIGYALEPLYLRPYRQTPVMTISQSSATSLRDEMGFRGEIGIMPMAIDQYPAPAPLPLSQRAATIVALGRVTPSKRLDHTLRALALLIEPPFDRLHLEIIGGGDEAVRRSLGHLAHDLGIAERIAWSGFLSEDQKRAHLARASALVMNSAREGWGLAVSEANLAGTPAVGYAIPGLRDSIHDGTTGVVTEESPAALAEGLRMLLGDADRYHRLAMAAQRDAERLTWDATTDFVEQFLTRIARR
jgi:glycosyltransferase involved in cell wall biosynthesis